MLMPPVQLEEWRKHSSEGGRAIIAGLIFIYSCSQSRAIVMEMDCHMGLLIHFNSALNSEQYFINKILSKMIEVIQVYSV
jgi:hypothetical protein